jgi:hypothetical protein
MLVNQVTERLQTTPPKPMRFAFSFALYFDQDAETAQSASLVALSARSLSVAAIHATFSLSADARVAEWQTLRT